MAATAFSRGFNPLPQMQQMGFRPTSGLRTKKHQAALFAQGLTPTKGGAHVRGDGIDLIPPRGMSQQQGIDWVERTYPGAKAIKSNNGAIHITFPGWGGAPDISNSRGRY